MSNAVQATSRQRTYSITKADMEAARLVFVFVRDAKPKRKVAVPVPEGYTWDDFLRQVKQKLKINGVKEITHVSSGQRVTSLDELQDIDELCVTEGIEATRSLAMNSQGALQQGADGTAEITAQSSDRPQPMTPDRGASLKAASSLSHAPSSSHQGLGHAPSNRPDSDDMKYSRRTHPLKRALQKWFPALFAPGLPVSTRDAERADSGKLTDAVRMAGGKRRKGRRGVLSLRNVLLLLMVATCVLTMMWLLSRSTPNIS